MKAENLLKELNEKSIEKFGQEVNFDHREGQGTFIIFPNGKVIADISNSDTEESSLRRAYEYFKSL